MSRVFDALGGILSSQNQATPPGMAWPVLPSAFGSPCAGSVENGSQSKVGVITDRPAVSSW